MIDLERNFVCAVLHDENIMYQTNISYDDLVDIPSRLVLKACKEISIRGDKPDISAVSNELHGRVSVTDIMDIFDRGALHVNWKMYAKKLTTGIMGRKLEQLIPMMKDMISSGEHPESIISKTSEYLDKIAIGFKEYKITGFAELIPGIIDKIQEGIGSKNTGLTGISTGIPMLDDLTGGFKKRELVYIGGRPSDGKSAALNGFILAAANSGHNPGVISVESSLTEIIKRIVSSSSRVPLGNIKSSMLTQSQIAKIGDRAATIYNVNPYGYDEPNATLNTVITHARRMVSVYKCDCLYIDYIQQMTPNNKTIKRNEQVADMSKALKSLGRELDVPVVVAAQLRRPQQGKHNARPSVDDFGESSQIEKDGDIEILIWHKDNEETGMKESFFLLEKQRDGATGDIPVYFNKDIVRFEERVQS